MTGEAAAADDTDAAEKFPAFPKAIIEDGGDVFFLQNKFSTLMRLVCFEKGCHV